MPVCWSGSIQADIRKPFLAYKPTAHTGSAGQVQSSWAGEWSTESAVGQTQGVDIIRACACVRTFQPRAGRQWDLRGLHAASDVNGLLLRAASVRAGQTAGAGPPCSSPRRQRAQNPRHKSDRPRRHRARHFTGQHRTLLFCSFLLTH